MWEREIDIHQVAEVRTKTTTYLGAGAINKMSDIAAALTGRGIKKAVVVTGKGSYIKSGAWDVVKKALDEKGIGYVVYNKITPNPTADQVDEAVKIARDFGATAVIAIGGGSPIDAGKGVAILLAYPDQTARDLCEFKFSVEKAVPVIAVNLTHGTGTEVDRFAVITIPEKEFKPVLAFDCIYPLYSIDDPALMTLLPPDQTSYVSVDAVNHVIEAATTKAGNPLAVSLAKETIDIVARYLPQARKDPGDLAARYHLLYASLIAGVAFDNGLLHLTHALEHPLSGLKPELAHGLGLGILLPAVVKQIYPAKAGILAAILAPLVPGLQGTPDEAAQAHDGLKKWLKQVGIKQHLTEEGFTAKDIDRLVELAFDTPSLGLLLSMAPVEASRDVVRTIYEDSL
ncbi:iron-containing alcohol dehydrogenase [Acetonema longum]|uniref:Iron-containing alcohol dehydrogenase n=1 Tax=Acetonema longum DSM 6540 TaxID=1009370 RepID=F7NJ81_9FIRM|nr:iron-containing alcohol dehydrogenase [Acetonema longum]EGO63829.1 iron-containing alcohol dehydrogenase [Acetonema longum DSM 6540]